MSLSRRGFPTSHYSLPITRSRSRYEQYVLNQEKAVKKICAAAKRGVISIEKKSGNIVVEFNASSFLAFEEATNAVLKNHVFSHDKDNEGRVVRKIFKVTKDGESLYTLSLYRTTLKALINGRCLDRFWDDLRSILSVAGLDDTGNVPVSCCTNVGGVVPIQSTVNHDCSDLVHLANVTLPSELEHAESVIVDDVVIEQKNVAGHDALLDSKPNSLSAPGPSGNCFEKTVVSHLGVAKVRGFPSPQTGRETDSAVPSAPLNGGNSCCPTSVDSVDSPQPGGSSSWLHQWPNASLHPDVATKVTCHAGAFPAAQKDARLSSDSPQPSTPTSHSDNCPKAPVHPADASGRGKESALHLQLKLTVSPTHPDMNDPCGQTSAATLPEPEIDIPCLPDAPTPHHSSSSSSTDYLLAPQNKTHILIQHPSPQPEPSPPAPHPLSPQPPQSSCSIEPDPENHLNCLTEDQGVVIASHSHVDTENSSTPTLDNADSSDFLPHTTALASLQCLHTNILDTKTQLANKLKAQNKELTSFMQDVLDRMQEMQRDITSLQHTVLTLVDKHKHLKQPQGCLCRCQQASSPHAIDSRKKTCSENNPTVKETCNESETQATSAYTTRPSPVLSQKESSHKTQNITHTNNSTIYPHAEKAEPPAWSQSKSEGKLIPRGAEHLILGCSLLRNVRRRMVCRQGTVHILTLHNYKVANITEKLRANSSTQYTTKSVSFLVSGDETHDETRTQQEYDELSSVASETFPKATIRFIALPYNKHSAAHIQKCNMAMAQVAKTKEHVQFVYISNYTNYMTDDNGLLTKTSNIQLTKGLRGYIQSPSPRMQKAQANFQMNATDKSSSLLPTPPSPPLGLANRANYRHTLLPTPPHPSISAQKGNFTKKKTPSQAEVMYNKNFPPLPRNRANRPNYNVQTQSTSVKPNKRTNTIYSEKTDEVTGTDANSTTLSPASLTYQSSPRNTNTDTHKYEQSQTSQLYNPKPTHIIPTIPHHIPSIPRMPPYVPFHPFFPFYPFMEWQSRLPFIRPAPTM